MIVNGTNYSPESLDVNPCSFIFQHATYRPHLPAIYYEGRTMSYEEITQRVRSFAAYLDEIGVRRGDRVAYLGLNSTSFLFTMLASWWLGAVFQPLNFRLSESELSQLLLQGTPHTIVVEGPHLPLAKQVYGIERHNVVIVDTDAAAPVDGRIPLYWRTMSSAQETNPVNVAKPRPMMMADLALLLFTSGTTGLPKGVQLTFGNLFWNSFNVDTLVDSRPGDVTLVAAPMFHVGALNSFAIRALTRGNAVLVHRGFDPAKVLQEINEFQVASAFLVPAQLEVMQKHRDFADADLSSMRSTICAGAPVSAALIRRYLEKGVNVQQAWGLTETAPFATYLPADMTSKKTGSCGFPMPFTEVKLVDTDTGEDIKEPGVAGEMWVRGPNVATGYWNNPEVTQKSYTAGWFHSGDIGHRDEDGYYYVVDRLKDLIITGGENVYPAEVERILAEMDGILSSAVVGLPDEKWGEIVVAVIQANEGEEAPTLEEVRKHCEHFLARYKLPKKVMVVDEIFRNTAGKIDKIKTRQYVRELADQEYERDPADVNA